MVYSPIHELINDIRKKYTGKSVSIIDVRNIEEKYKLCSMTNIRNDNCAFLRITSFGLDEVVFEDVVVDLNLIKEFDSQETLMFNINKVLLNMAYGVNLVESNESVINVPITSPSFDFTTLKEENVRLNKKIEELESKIANLSMKNGQISLFDQDNGEN